MSESVRQKLLEVVHTLDLIEVHGKSNLDMLLGCILMLNGMIAEAKNDG